MQFNRLILYGFILVFNILFFEDALSQSRYEWTLTECVERARQVNLEILDAQQSLAIRSINSKEARHARYPNLRLSTNGGRRSGRTLNPVTNSFITQSSVYQVGSLSSQAVLFGGGINHNIKNATALEARERYLVFETEDQVVLRVVELYFNALLAKESVDQSKIALKSTEDQINRAKRLVEAGSLPRGEVFELEAQKSRDHQEIVRSENEYQLALYGLMDIMQLEFNDSISLTSIDLDDMRWDDSILEMPVEDLFAYASKTQPGFIADSLAVVAQKYRIKAQKASLGPRLDIGFDMSDNYSDQTQQITGFNRSFEDLTVEINEMPVVIGFPEVDPIFEDLGYLEQLENNLGYSMFIGLSIPIYDRLSRSSSVKREEITLEQLQLRNQRELLNLRADIFNAMALAKAAKQNMAASESAVKAQEESLRIVQKRFDIGASNQFELTAALNNMRVANLSLIQSKYDYLYRLKLLEFYLGNPMKL